MYWEAGAGLRIMQVDKSPAYYNVTTPQQNLTVSIPWSNSQTYWNLAGMSALCYYYGVEQVHPPPTSPCGAHAHAQTYFANGSQHLWCWGSPPKRVSNPA